MQKLQLYIQGTRMDMFDDESVSITDTIKNIKDVSKIFTEFTRTFNLPASKANNKIFKHYYNFNIQDGYDARVRVPAQIDLNFLPYKKGYIKLEGVSLKNNKPHTYKITFFGNTISLKEKFGEDKLQDLDWLDNFNTTSSGDKLLFESVMYKDFMQFQKNVTVDSVTYLQPVQIPLLTHSQRLYYNSGTHTEADGNLYWHGGAHYHGIKWNELKYALKVPYIIKAIEEKYGLTFSTDFFNASNTSWENLYMWLHRAKGQVTSAGQVTEYTYYVDDWGTSAGFETSMSSTGALTINTGVFFPEARLSLTTASAQEYSYTIYYYGTAQHTRTGIVGNSSLLIDPAPLGTPITVSITTTAAMTFTDIEWEIDGEVQGDPPFTDTYNTGTVNVPEQFEFKITQQIPEMKVIDFMTGLFQMFNLVAYVEDDVIVVKTLDNFYTGGTSYDISQYLDVRSSEIDAALPFREVTYGYEGTDTFLAAQHSQLFAKDWGKEEFRNDVSTVFSGDIHKYVIPFEHMKYERIINGDTGLNTSFHWGWCVDDNQESYIGKPILFYLQRSGVFSYSFVSEVDENNVGIAHSQNFYHWRPCNSNMNVGTFANQPSLNFYQEVDEWQRENNPNTLFNNYHRTYISSVFDKSRRISKFTAFLPQRILINMTLADRFVINSQSYKINSITTNLLTGESKLELLNEG